MQYTSPVHSRSPIEYVDWPSMWKVLGYRWIDVGDAGQSLGAADLTRLGGLARVVDA